MNNTKCRMAAEELLKEASKARTRVEVGGASEWKRKPSRINKMFLIKTFHICKNNDIDVNNYSSISDNIISYFLCYYWRF